MGQIYQCSVSPSPRALMAVTQRWWRQHTRRSQGGAGPCVASSRMVRMITSITPVVGDAEFLRGSALTHHSLPLMSSQPEGVAAWLWCWVFPWKRRWPASDPWPPVFEQVGAGTPPSRCLAGPVVAVVDDQDPVPGAATPPTLLLLLLLLLLLATRMTEDCTYIVQAWSSGQGQRGKPRWTLW